MSLGHGLAGVIHFVPGQVVLVIPVIGGNIVRRLIAPLLQVYVLVLERVGQLVRQNRLLLVHAHPVQHVHRLGLGVVIGFDLLIQKLQQEGLEVEVLVQQPEFLQYDFALLQPLGVLVVAELLTEIGFHFGAGPYLPFHRALDGQPCLLAGELHELIHQRKQFLGLIGRDVGLALARLPRRRSRLCRRRGSLPGAWNRRRRLSQHRAGSQQRRNTQAYQPFTAQHSRLSSNIYHLRSLPGVIHGANRLRPLPESIIRMRR